jgi:two-component system cell cycle response regulator DivK
MRLFTDLLETRGYRILKARDGSEGLELARRFHPDLILMNLRLPDISGLEIAKSIKSEKDLIGIPIIAVTAFAMTGDEAKTRRAGCDGYIAKPISIRDFLATVERFIR